METCVVRSVNGGNTAKRIEFVRAMDMLARCINDENVFEGWLMNGVPDGLIKNASDESIAEFTDDETIKDFMDCFLRCMVSASKSGGLFYCD